MKPKKFAHKYKQTLKQATKIKASVYNIRAKVQASENKLWADLFLEGFS